MTNEEVKTQIQQLLDKINDASALNKILTVVKTFYEFFAKE